MMKSIYGKLICGFLITIAFSFSVAGYVALRNNYDQIEDMAKSELSATSEYVVGILNSLDDANINDIMNKYAISSEVYITLYSPELDYYTFNIIMMKTKTGVSMSAKVCKPMAARQKSMVLMYIYLFKRILVMKKEFLLILLF